MPVGRLLSVDLVSDAASRAGYDCESSRLFRWGRILFRLSLACTLWLDGRGLAVFGGIELLEESDVVDVAAEKFYTHAVFQRDNRGLDRAPDNTFQLAVGPVGKVDSYIQFCARHKGMVRSDEEPISGKVARNCTIRFAFADELRLEPPDKPLVPPSNFQKGS